MTESEFIAATDLERILIIRASMEDMECDNPEIHRIVSEADSLLSECEDILRDQVQAYLKR